MKNKEKLYPVALTSIVMILFLIIVSSVALASDTQNTSPAAQCAYIASIGSNNVSVTDTATNNVTATVTVGSNPSGVAVNPEEQRYMWQTMDNNTVSVIDTATNTVIATVPVGSYPYGVAVNPEGTKVYVTNSRQQ